jgi:hypothetical protein
MIVQGNDRILFIKRGDNFQPVGCLTTNGLDESIEFLPTTTRNSQGWETQRPTTQNYSINFEGLQVPTAFRSDTDFANFYTLTVNFLENVDFNVRFRINGNAGWFTLIRKSTTTDTDLIDELPSTYVLRGATLEDTIDNIIANLNIYNVNANVEYSRDGTSLVATLVNEGTYTITLFQLIDTTTFEDVGDFDLTFDSVPNPNPLISYDRLRIMKRNRELITWRIMSSSPVPAYIDEGQGYISSISDVSGVNQDATFSGSIVGYGVPIFIINQAALATGDDFVEDGNDNLIEP